MAADQVTSEDLIEIEAGTAQDVDDLNTNFTTLATAINEHADELDSLDAYGYNDMTLNDLLNAMMMGVYG